MDIQKGFRWVKCRLYPEMPRLKSSGVEQRKTQSHVISRVKLLVPGLALMMAHEMEAP